MWTIWDFKIPSLFSTEISHSTPVPASTTLRIGTLAVNIGLTPETCPWPKVKEHATVKRFYEAASKILLETIITYGLVILRVLLCRRYTGRFVNRGEF